MEQQQIGLEFGFENGFISWQGLGKLVVSPPRPSGGDFSVKNGNDIAKAEALGSMFGRSLGGDEVAVE